MHKELLQSWYVLIFLYVSRNLMYKTRRKSYTTSLKLCSDESILESISAHISVVGSKILMIRYV